MSARDRTTSQRGVPACADHAAPADSSPRPRTPAVSHKEKKRFKRRLTQYEGERKKADCLGLIFADIPARRTRAQDEMFAPSPGLVGLGWLGKGTESMEKSGLRPYGDEKPAGVKIHSCSNITLLFFCDWRVDASSLTALQTTRFVTPRWTFGSNASGLHQDAGVLTLRFDVSFSLASTCTFADTSLPIGANGANLTGGGADAVVRTLQRQGLQPLCGRVGCNRCWHVRPPKDGTETASSERQLDAESKGWRFAQYSTRGLGSALANAGPRQRRAARPTWTSPSALSRISPRTPMPARRGRLPRLIFPACPLSTGRAPLPRAQNPFPRHLRLPAHPVPLSRTASSKTNTLEARASIVIPTLHLPATRPPTPRIWSGGFASYTPVARPYVPDTRCRFYTHNSDLLAQRVAVSVVVTPSLLLLLSLCCLVISSSAETMEDVTFTLSAEDAAAVLAALPGLVRNRAPASPTHSALQCLQDRIGRRLHWTYASADVPMPPSSPPQLTPLSAPLLQPSPLLQPPLLRSTPSPSVSPPQPALLSPPPLQPALSSSMPFPQPPLPIHSRCSNAPIVAPSAGPVVAAFAFAAAFPIVTASAIALYAIPVCVAPSARPVVAAAAAACAVTLYAIPAAPLPIHSSATALIAITLTRYPHQISCRGSFFSGRAIVGPLRGAAFPSPASLATLRPLCGVLNAVVLRLTQRVMRRVEMKQMAREQPSRFAGGRRAHGVVTGHEKNLANQQRKP
ncbi:hypothetical protein C8J57DRAFT_1507214 [Mycena rebaudengoi]|nr:hypothetical protein C8J57DRAFT_1507214 [Mycena rebaudengoi]